VCAALVVALAGCGRGRTATPAEARLEREDLVVVAHALRSAEEPVDREVAAARSAWPLLVDGLPRSISASVRARIGAAVQAAARLPLPALLGEREAAALTGPASPLAGRYRDFQQLCSDSWRLIGDALAEVRRGGAAARFVRATAPLYIEGIYDSHYSLAETGKELLAAYETLGGAPAFGSSLTAREVRQLAESYARLRDRLQPHERVRLGS
jgi:hypothetical protein